MKPLFVAGSPRSGTTALTDYLNQHPEILICRERYKFVPLKVNPSFFTFERILNYGEKETNIPRGYHEELVTRKAPERLKWVGDKYPHYARHFKELARNNPGAHFLVLYRPLEEVAESFEARAKDPQDSWPEKNGFERGVQVWNSTIESTREFVEGTPDHNVMLVSYHDFFYRNESCISLISRFLEVEFDEPVREACRKMSFRFEILRRSKEPLTEEQASFVRDNKDRAAEEWILDRMDKQWREFGRIPVTEPPDQREVERQVEELERQLTEVRRENQRLKQSNQRLTARMQALPAVPTLEERHSQAKTPAEASASVEESPRVEESAPQTTHGLQLADGGTAQGKALNLDDYDFLDFGASKGGSIEFARRRLGGVRGIGIDIDPSKNDLMLRAGYDYMQGDITNLDFPSDSVRFVVMSHLLEHLPDLQAVENTLRSAARVASDFLFIQGPYFDADEFLRGQGLKFYWSDWHGHKCHLTASQLRKILLDLGLEDFVIMGCGRVIDSFDSAVHPLGSPRDHHAYDPEVHPGKSFVNFRQPLYKEMVCYVKLRPFNDWKNILQARKGCEQIDNIEQRKPDRFSSATQRSHTPHSGKHDTIPGRTTPASERLLAEKARVETRGGAAGFVNEIEKRLMLVRRWSYLRYLHMREGLLRAEGIESVLAVGCGRGYAEVALALEFPEIRFHLTDVQGARTPHYHAAQRLVQRWALDNVTFGIRDILVPEQRDYYDLVASVEVLEHIENDALAAEEMRATANKYVFALVPFADKVANGNEELRARVYKNHEHHRVGYDEEDLLRLFPSVVTMRGCYWRERGGEFRKRLHSMSDEEIRDRLSELRAEAQRDIVEDVPKIYPEAQGIWMLAEV